MIKFLKIVLPLVFLAAGLFGAWSMVSTRAPVESAAPAFSPPLVEVRPLSPQNVQLRVRTQGTVMPRTESSLAPEISGRVVYVSPNFTTGGFFEEDEVLLRIDSRDFELAIAEAEARIAQARFLIEREQAEARAARREWEELGEGRASDLLLRTPQIAEAEAAQEAARASRELAERNLARTEIRAPYRGRVRSRSVDVGQFVVQGNPVAQLYAVDYAEVRLPIPREELAYVDLPFHFRDGQSPAGPEVILSAELGRRMYRWKGRIVRTEGEVDPESQMLFAVARVEDPYGGSGGAGRPPLAVGLFVEAEILGRWLSGVFVLPRTALWPDNRVLTVDSDHRLRFREVEIERTGVDDVIVTGGVSANDWLCLTRLETPVEGLKVEPMTGESFE